MTREPFVQFVRSRARHVRRARHVAFERCAVRCAIAVGVIFSGCLSSVASGAGSGAVGSAAPTGFLREGHAFTATLSDVTDAGDFVFAEPSGSRTVPAADLVAWGAFAERRQATLIILVDGSTLVADVLSIDAQAVVIAGRLWQETRLPRAAVRGIVFHPPADALARDQLLFRVLSPERQGEQLLLENGDELAGRLSEAMRPDAGGFTLTHIDWSPSDSAQPVRVSLARVIAVLLSPPAAAPLPAGARDVLVGLRDGSLIHAQTMGCSERSLDFQLVAGPHVITEPEPEFDARAPWRAVVSLQPLRAGVTYVSDLQPLGYRHIPFLDMAWPFVADRSVAGGRLRYAGHVWAKGLGMHSSSRVAYETHGRFRELHAEVAIDERAERQGSVIFRVYVQTDADNWTMAYESPIVRGGDPALAIRVDLRQAQRVALIVDFADRADQWDHADWLNARLIE
jgi:hypothetical protein